MAARTSTLQKKPQAVVNIEQADARPPVPITSGRGNRKPPTPPAPTLAELTPDAFRDFDADTEVAIVIRMDTTTNQLYYRAYNMADADAGLNMVRIGTAVAEGTIAALTQRLQGVIGALQPVAPATPE